MAINYGYYTLPVLSNYLSYINGTSLYGPTGTSKSSSRRPTTTTTTSATSDLSTYPTSSYYSDGGGRGPSGPASTGTNTSVSPGTPSSNSVIGQAVANQGIAGLQGMATQAAAMGALGYGFGMSPSQALGFGLSQGFSPASVGSVVGGMATTSLGLNQASPAVSGMVSSVIGGMLGGPIGGLLGGFIGPAVATLGLDAFNARDDEQTLDTIETMSPTTIGGYRGSQAFGLSPDPTLGITSVPGFGVPDVVSQMTQAMAPNMDEATLGRAQTALQGVLGTVSSRGAVNATLGPSVQGLLGSMMGWGPELSAPTEIADINVTNMMDDINSLDQNIADLSLDFGLTNTVSTPMGISPEAVSQEVASIAAQQGVPSSIGPSTDIGLSDLDAAVASLGIAAAVADVAQETAMAAEAADASADSAPGDFSGMASVAGVQGGLANVQGMHDAMTDRGFTMGFGVDPMGGRPGTTLGGTPSAPSTPDATVGAPSSLGGTPSAATAAANAAAASAVADAAIGAAMGQAPGATADNGQTGDDSSQGDDGSQGDTGDGDSSSGSDSGGGGSGEGGMGDGDGDSSDGDSSAGDGDAGDGDGDSSSGDGDSGF